MPSALWSRARGEVSIYDSIPLISQVQGGQVDVTIDFYRHAAFLVYAIVEDWRRVTVPEPIETEQQLGNQLGGLGRDKRHRRRSAICVLIEWALSRRRPSMSCVIEGRGRYNAELHEKSKVRFPIANESVEVVGFYSRHHRGIFTPRDSNFHMHVRTLDNRFSGHLEVFNWEHGVMLYLPTDASHLT